MSYANPDALVSTEWLAQHLDAPDVRVVDATYFLPVEQVDYRQEYEEEHIPGAVFFDIDAIADTDSPLPHMLPSPEKFASMVKELGLGDGTRIVCYDRNNLFSASRVWWMFRVMGHPDVAVLDGGFDKWHREGRPVTDVVPTPSPRHFTPRFDHTLIRTLPQIQEIVAGGQEPILDARGAGRFVGTDQEPWPNVRRGHIPGSLSLPYADFLNLAEQTMRPAEEIAARIKALGLDNHQGPITTTCGSGATACVLVLGFHLLGKDDVAVYDGSWTEWGREGADYPIETGPGGTN